MAVKRSVNKPRKVFIEASSFEELIKKSDVIIDRTLMIRDILTNTKKIVFITTPPKFGKTINLDMIKTFVNLNVDENGQQLIDTQYTFSYQFFKYGKVLTNKHSYQRLEQSPLISRHTPIFLKYHGQYPAIYVDFTNLTGYTFGEVIQSAKQKICDAFQPHSYILNILQSDKSEEAQEKAKKLQQYVQADVNLKEEDIARSIQFLNNLLVRTYQKCVYIFIDNIDAALDLMLRKGFYSNEDERFIINFFESLLKYTFRENVNFNKGIITGTYQFTRKFFDMYKIPLSRYTALYNPLYPYFGFNPEHVASLCDHAGIEATLAKQGGDWYKGYAMGINESSSLSSPYSILNFIQTEKIEDYWEQSTHQSMNIRNMLEIDRIMKTFQELLHGDVIVNLNYLNISRIDITYLNRILNEKRDFLVTEQLYKLTMYYLIDIGYLTFNGFQYVNTHKSYFTRLRLPNQERRHQVRLMLRWYYIRKQKINAKNVDKVSSELTKIIRSEDHDEVAITDGMRILFEDLPVFVSQEETSPQVYPINEAIVDSTLNFLALNMRYVHNFEVKVNHNGCNMTVYNVEGEAAIVQFGFQEKSVDDIMQIAKTQHNIFNQSAYPIHRIKFIATNVLMDKKVELKIETEVL